MHTARANLVEASQKATRARRLADRGVSAPATAVDLEARAAGLNASVKAAKAEVRAAQAEVARLRVDLSYTKVVAPISGTVVTKPAEVGELVGLDREILELADFDSLLVETDVPESRLHKIKPGAPCEIMLDAFPGRRLRGAVETIKPQVDRAKATVTVKVRFTDGQDGVLPQMASRVNFLAKALDQDAVNEPPKHVVPGDAIVERAGSKVVLCDRRR